MAAGKKNGGALAANGNHRQKKLLAMMLSCRARPLQRPRLAQGRIYQPLGDQAELRAEVCRYTPVIRHPIEVPVVVDMVFHFARGRNQQMYPVGPSYGDEDNLRKAVNDALVFAALLKDDRLVIGGQTLKLYGEEDMVLVEIWSANH